MAQSTPFLDSMAHDNPEGLTFKSNPKSKKEPNNLGSQVKPNSFKATIKTKSIDDNPNVLANIIRKKVDCLGREELF